MVHRLQWIVSAGYLPGPVVQTLDRIIHRINHYPAKKYYGNQLLHLLDSDLSGGWRALSNV